MKRLFNFFSIIIISICSIIGCSENFLNESPDFMDPDIVALSNVIGFESAIAGLHAAARDEWVDAAERCFFMHIGTDIATTGDEALPTGKNYLTTVTPTATPVTFYWNWAYQNVIPRANTIISAGANNDVNWSNEAQKNFYIAEAKFFRAYAYNIIVNLFGRVPIVDKPAREPKFDYIRAERREVFEFIREDLIFASEWLPETASSEGRIVKAAADHLLSEVYISLGMYDEAIASASKVIDSPLYDLMKVRFGNFKDEPGDPYSDLFKDNNQSRASGNKEMIFCYQIEYNTPGGQGAAGGNVWLRAWGSRYFDLKDPDGAAGMSVTDSLGRSVGWVRPTNYALYDIWKDNPDDMRNSPHNIRRIWYYNNEKSAYLNQQVLPRQNIDTMYVLYPRIRKIEGLALGGATIGRTYKDIPVMRLAETYLLRAEAYMKKGGVENLQEAADDINKVRDRANATPCNINDITMDFILDERARELLVEEPRRKTLARTGTLVDRVRRYNIRASTRETIQDYHQWFPIPQSAIDANKGAKLGQNYGYPDATDSEIIDIL
jgi:hypothetical protein